MGDSVGKTYEMLWDCEFCGTKKLLGNTHKHCPGCGAVQNPEKRYFPEESEKVAVEDHEFAGADRVCPSCKISNSAKAKHCMECGSPMEGGQSVKLVTDAPKPAPKPTAVATTGAPPPKKSAAPLIIGGGIILVVAAVLVVALWKKEAALTVSGHTWERHIAIERFAPLSQDEWCNLMPQDAYNISRFRDVRSYNQIPDGENCTTKRVDNGDGTYSEKQECTPKYRKEPVYDDKCRFTVNRWAENREVVAKGQRLRETPAWPEVNLPAAAAQPVLGAERMGRRTEKYTVQFVGKPGELYSCDFPQTVWRGYPDASKWKGNVGVVTNALDCSSLAAPK
jgi:hypothetical protein